MEKIGRLAPLNKGKRDGVKSINLRPIEGEDGHADESGAVWPQELQLRRKSRLRGDPVSAHVR